MVSTTGSRSILEQTPKITDMNARLLKNISIVLVETSHPGNIGAVARAMKTMSVTDLRLVNPTNYPGAEVTARAAGADDILARAAVYADVASAIADAHLVMGSSTRGRSIPWPIIDPVSAAEKAAGCLAQGRKVVLMFGGERAGLSNEELDYCHCVVNIPANPDFCSLNIAAAVQIICYELYRMTAEASHNKAAGNEVADSVSAEQMKLFYQHLEQCLIDIDYLDPEKPRRLMRRLRRLFNRIELDDNEYNIMRGILTAAQQARRGRKR